VTDTRPQQVATQAEAHRSRPALALDLTVGVTSLVVETTGAAGGTVVDAVRPVLRTFGLPARLLWDLSGAGSRVGQSSESFRLLVERGEQRREVLRLELARLLDLVVPAVASEVLRRVDIDALAEEVLAALDLPEIIRESTGTVGSGVVRGVRMRGISGDEAVRRAFARLTSRTNGSEPQS
jgi:hypothetical protein